MEKENLHLLINEEIYRIEDETQKSTREGVENADPSTKQKEDAIKEPDLIQKTADQTASESSRHESPEIPEIETEKVEALPFAVFHESTKQEELDLIHKIIDACQLNAERYKIFGNGFDQGVQFEKALVFVGTAKSYYEPIPYKGSFFLCSQPAHVLMTDKNQKAQLWNALQQFLNLTQ